MTSRKSAADILGMPPWTDDQLTRAYLADFQGIHRALRSHPGYRAHAEIEQLSISKRIFDKAVVALKSAVDDFRSHSEAPGFRTRKTATEFKDLTLAVQSALFNAAAAAMAYTNRAKVIGTRLKVGGFVNKRTLFEQTERHQFICELRNHFSHVAPLIAEWQLSWVAAGAPTVAKFILEAADLDEASKQGRQRWSQLAQNFINSNRASGVNIVAVFDDHRAEITAFDDWLNAAAEVAGGADLVAYRETDRRLRAIAFRMAWKAWVIPFIQQADPRRVLNSFLTANEIAVVDQLPANSREQVERLIEYLDPDQAFDDEIREKVRVKFGLDHRLG